MNQGTFSYVLVQYHHSQILGEVLNIGLFAYFPKHNQIKFLYPEKLIRLKYAYPNAQEKTLKSYLKHFETRVNELNLNPEIFTHFDLNESLLKFLHSEFLPSDSTALQLGTLRKSIVYTPDLNKITNQLYNLYFSVFQHQENVVNRIDEYSLLLKYKKLFEELTRNSSIELNEDHIRFDYEVEQTTGNIFKFDIAWKDKSQLHLIKPISFDLRKPDAITGKAYRYCGEFIDLEEYASDHKINFDLLLSKPQDQSLFRNYDDAIRILSRPKHVNLVEYEELSDYAKLTAQALLFDN